MEITLFLFAIACGVLFCIVRFFQQSATQYERVFLVGIAVLLLYAGYDNSVKNRLDITKTRETVKGILSIVEKSLKESGIPNIHVNIPIQNILESDQQLLRAVLGLVKYAKYDKDAVVNVLRSLIEFYDIYADVLLEAKPPTVHVSKLIDVRLRMMERMHALFVSLPQMKNAKMFEYIMLVLQSTTYKSLNVLKNKYGTTGHEAPMAMNSDPYSPEMLWDSY